MKKLLTIGGCEDCCYYNDCDCNLVHRQVDCDDQLPSWCPLPDANPQRYALIVDYHGAATMEPRDDGENVLYNWNRWRRNL